MRVFSNLFRRVRSLAGRIDLPRREDAPYLFVGVFLTFFSIGPMSEMTRNQPHNIAGLIMTGLISGTIAVGYGILGTYRKYWVLPLVMLFQWYGADLLFTSAIRAGLVWKVDAADAAGMKRVAILLAISVIAVGHGFLITFARRIGRTASAAKAQLAIAAEMHRAIVPPIDVKLGSLHVVGRSDASSVMGGDLIDIVRHDHGIDIVLADVSGHGVKAGVVMAMLKAAVRTVLGAPRGVSNGGAGAAHLGDSTGQLSRVLAELCEPGMFATFVVLRIFTGETAATGGQASLKAELCTAGHGPIMHYIAAKKQWIEIDNECLPLAISADECFTVRELLLSPCDRIVILTDGLIEAFGSSGLQFGNDGITASLIAASSSGPASPATLCERLLADSRAHGLQIDDQSVIAVAMM